MNALPDMLAAIDGPIRLLIYGEFALFLTILTFRPTPSRVRWPLLVLLAAVSAYLYLSGPWPPVQGWLRPVLIGLTAAAPFALWALALSIFDDRFQLPPWGWPALVLVVCFAGAIEYAGEAEFWLRTGLRVLSILALLHAVWRVISGRSDDMVERRRQARVILVVLIVLQAIASLLVELALPDIADRAPLEPVAALAILVLTTGLATALLRPEGLDVAPITRPDSRRSNDDPDSSLIAQIEELATDGGLFAPGLTVATLAAQLAVPEYRLRRAINQGLGHRNFSAFLNSHRIFEACRRLRDPELARLPVLTIAMDLGYGSLGPFNRAFREITGTTPTAFRAGDVTGNPADS